MSSGNISASNSTINTTTTINTPPKPQNTTIENDIELAVNLPPDENILHFDYRTDNLKQFINNINNSKQIKPLKICQWNIERGIKLDAIIDILRQTDADIIALQEIDCGLSRSEYIETGIAIAKELGLNYVFQREFIELEGDIDKQYFYEQYHNNSNPTTISRHNPSYQPNYRKSTTQISTTNVKHNPLIQYHPTPIATTSTYKYKHYGVKSDVPGCHGNCILTKFNIEQIISIEHQHHPYDWNKNGHLLNEPRTGARRTLCCVIQAPKSFIAKKLHNPNPNQDSFYIVDHLLQQPIDNTTDLGDKSMNINMDNDNSDNQSFISIPVYTCHLELFCGLIDRLKILAELFSHYRTNFHHQTQHILNQQNQPSKLESDTIEKQSYGLILGDFNTLAHSIARFSPKYCKDQLRWRSWGYTEAEWWYKYVLDTKQYQPNYYKYYSQLTNNHDNNSNSISTIDTPLSQFAFPQLTQHELVNLINPGFDESFGPAVETLTSYNGWFYGKLDWTLNNGFYVVNTDLINLDYSASDHRGMTLDVFLKPIEIFNQTSNNNNNSNIFSQFNPFSDNLLSPKLPLKPVIPHHLQPNFHPRTYLITPSINTKVNRNITTLCDSNDGNTSNQQAVNSHSIQLFSKNDHYIIYPVVRDFIDGYHDQSQGIIGFIQRNCTDFVQYSLSFIIPTIFAIFYVLLCFDQ
jgi:hypothetical protein